MSAVSGGRQLMVMAQMPAFGTNLKNFAVQRIRPLLGVQRKGPAQLSFVCP